MCQKVFEIFMNMIIPIFKSSNYITDTILIIIDTILIIINTI